MTLVNNHDSLGVKPKRQVVSQLDRLKAGLETDDLSTVTYTQNCDALGGECACGKKGIIYRFFVKNQAGKVFVVGSECINHFTQSVQNEIKSHDKQLRNKAKKIREKNEADKILQTAKDLLIKIPDYSQGKFNWSIKCCETVKEAKRIVKSMQYEIANLS